MISDPLETKPETARLFRADVACHWEDSDAVVQEMLVTVSSTCDFDPRWFPHERPVGFIDMYLYRVRCANCIGRHESPKRVVNPAIPTDINLFFQRISV